MNYQTKSPFPMTEHGEESLSETMAAHLQSFGEWQIQKDIIYLDNGAFGSCPKSVVEKQKSIRQRIEENPHEFFERSYVSGLDASRRSLADFLHVDHRDIFLLPGATHAMNVVIQSLRFNPDDEILTTNVAYSSVRMVLDHVAKRDGAHIVVVDVPLLVTGPEDVMQRILAGVTPRTRFAVIDHIPSRTGLVLPAKQIVKELESRGIDTLVDGAHAPGMIHLDLEDINAAYYVANCHKWMCAPRGIGFLHVRRDRAQNIKPLVIARSPYVVGKSKHSVLEHSFGWMGTYCPSAMLSIPSAIDHLNTVMPGGYSGLTSRNHDLAVLARRIVCKAIGVDIPCPDSMIAAMATIPLSDSPGPEQEGMLPIQQTLWKEHGIVIPVYSWPSYPKRVVRLSVQAYNTLDQYLKLADCLRLVLRKERNSSSLVSVGSIEPPTPPYTRRQSDDSAYSSSSEGHLACGCSSSGIKSLIAGQGVLGPPYQDIEKPTLAMLSNLAGSRLLRILRGTFSFDPVSLFPTAGDVEAALTLTPEIQKHANMETSKMAYMLSCIPRRRIPEIMASSISQLLGTEDVIENWPLRMNTLKNQSQILSRAIILEMKAPRAPCKFTLDRNEFVSRVVPYETETHKDNLSLKFWSRALVDFTTKGRWSPARITSFLQIHAFLRDPVCGLRGNFKSRKDNFLKLLTNLTKELEESGRAIREDVAAQLAAESSFLSQPLISNASCVHFSYDQQLIYSYVDISDMARSEFSCPEIVVGMIGDILNSRSGDEILIAPIAVANIHPVCSSHDSRQVIIDGNNRITTLTFLKFVSIYGLSKLEEAEDNLREYCRDSGFGPVYFVDFCAVLQMLRNNAVHVLSQLQTGATLGHFNNITQVPCLITEEASFITKVLVNGEEIAQPIHQAIFATDDLLVALPAKMQCHGRAKGFKALPVR
ncbi:isopenicillin N epimerase [Fusarium phyllophilum]|uniref:Isopenicillin N epimerase n=1 Tax=Fusarium phyllophilum TaxID=47803 RepID=A0A8H5MR57_9HYPO|nr:isopenicillin N epimerase [Fusarium phyllophilum]